MRNRAKMALNQYRDVSINSTVTEASPHRLVQMMYEGALSRIFKAKGGMERADIKLKGEQISQAIAIVDSLRASLNTKEGGEMAENLWSLYDYITRRLVIANSQNKTEILDECASLLGQVKEAWDQIPPKFHRASKQELRQSAVAG
ncbi:MAG: flagellar export chaperone FliS [Gammaproteobacteria bacterium]|jgi:flagellar protein FliS|nr:flagellar export chaperone FliS [Gammaproteobacteria bacterium]MBT4607903.1 flagellar export chaperone FliS [Thiotrichales bacterium]MBT3471787.1 flagellar export chaperone FliS [Gammaproteobacteria bacterium]MBT3966536.1 flagellar export chaperone FliS [Gammaproteobacteria bacterium]MBT4080892.1 flagellar export chaperone FliS [Gammaproteobacteria bacterium]